MINTVKYIILLLTCLLSSSVVASNQKTIIDIVNYSYLRGSAEIKYTPNTHKKYIGGMGEVGYQFNIQETGWYSIIMQSARWPTSILIDDKLVTHTALDDYREIPNKLSKNNHNKILNVFLDKGAHVIAFDHSWAPGLPWIKYIAIKPADKPEDRVSVKIVSSRAVYGQNEPIPIKLLVSQHPYPYAINIIVTDDVNGRVINKDTISTGIGIGNQEINYTLPSSNGGVYSVDFVDNLKNKVVKSFQYVVVNDVAIDSVVDEDKVVISTIDVARQKPDYSSSKTIVTNSADGSYRESEGIGYYNNKSSPDYFSYIIETPEVNQLYMVEVLIPDDKKRTFTVSVIDSEPNPYALDSGVITGREHPLSMGTKKLHIYFYSKNSQQRLLFLNWHSGERIAVKKVNLYKINKLSQNNVTVKNQRRNAMYFEEPMRFTTYFGANTDVKDWVNIENAVTRWAEWSRSNYVNQWVVTVAAYQSRMWPSKLLPGLAPGDSWSGGMLGKSSNKDIIEKDIMWLMLLVAEKYNIKVTFELQIKPNKTMVSYLTDHWQTNSDENNQDHMIVSKNGELGNTGPQRPYFNPVNHNVQNWIKSIFGELTNRYHTLPAFDGVAVRMMKWSFSGWQTFPSIDWGYGDYTITKFEKETKVVMPDVGFGKDRFKKRYNWLMENAYNDWVEWRTKVIHEYHTRLENILMSKREDLTLYFDIINPTYTNPERKFKGKESNLNRLLGIEEYDNKGWSGLLKEAGFDVQKYRSNRNVVMVPAKKYPAGIRINSVSPYASYRVAALMDGVIDHKAIKSSQKTDGTSFTSSIMFYNEYMEADINMRDIGLDVGPSTKKRGGKLRICGVLNPAGNNMLSRYANAFAEGNITYLIDGGLGYTLGQPHITKEFMKEYMSIPAIGMKRHADTHDAVALWYGPDKSNSYFYIVNRANYPINVVVEFSKKSNVKRITTGKSYSGKKLSLSIKPYEMLSFQSDNMDTKIMNVEIKYPDNEILSVQKQLRQARKIIKDFKSSSYAKKYTTEIQTAESALDVVQRKHNAAEYYKARMGLMSHNLVRIYSLRKNTVPEKLWFH